MFIRHHQFADAYALMKQQAHRHSRDCTVQLWCAQPDVDALCALRMLQVSGILISIMEKEGRTENAHYWII